MVVATHPDLEIIKFTASVEGREPYDVQVEGVDEILVKVPESSTYTMTIHFKVKNRKLSQLKYKQAIKKFGVAIKTRDMYIGDEFEPSEEIYTQTFEKDTTPGGFAVRGSYPATSTYYAGDELLFTSDWTLEITKK